MSNCDDLSDLSHVELADLLRAERNYARELRNVLHRTERDLRVAGAHLDACRKIMKERDDTVDHLLVQVDKFISLAEQLRSRVAELEDLVRCK